VVLPRRVGPVRFPVVKILMWRRAGGWRALWVDVGLVLVVLFVVVVALGLAGCSVRVSSGPSGPPDADVMASRSAAAGRAVSPAAGQSGHHLDAAAVLAKLEASGLPVTGGVVGDPLAHPKDMVGKPPPPVGYLSHASFDLPGGDPDGVVGDVGRGGVIEVWSDGAAARGRAAAIAGVERQAATLGGEYELLSGAVLVRITDRVDAGLVDRIRPVVGALEP
jgi:hypothetical protein